MNEASRTVSGSQRIFLWRRACSRNFHGIGSDNRNGVEAKDIDVLEYFAQHPGKRQSPPPLTPDVDASFHRGRTGGQGWARKPGGLTS